MIALPYQILGAIALSAAMIGGGYLNGVAHEQSRQAVKQAQADDAAQIKYNGIAQELEDAKAKQVTVTRTVVKWRNKIIDRPVYRGACVDDDGRLLFNESIKATNPGVIDAAMSKPVTAGK